jgi:hypothetical protein
MTKKYAFSELEQGADKGRSRHGLLRLFGSPRELLAKANSDLIRLDELLSRGKLREALWPLMDCAIAVFHVGDWIRATHTDHHASSRRFAQRSQWIRMTRDVCHAAKHGDLTWAEDQAATHGPVIVKLECKSNDADDGQQRARLWVVTSDQARHGVADVLRHAISDWTRFLDQKGI